MLLKVKKYLVEELVMIFYYSIQLFYYYSVLLRIFIYIFFFE